MEQLWWIDLVKSQNLEKAKKDASVKLQTMPVEDRYWLDYAKNESQKTK
jgi:hypothetical protein